MLHQPFQEEKPETFSGFTIILTCALQIPVGGHYQLSLKGKFLSFLYRNLRTTCQEVNSKFFFLKDTSTAHRSMRGLLYSSRKKQGKSENWIECSAHLRHLHHDWLSTFNFTAQLFKCGCVPI